jgi:hypothetical protein
MMTSGERHSSGALLDRIQVQELDQDVRGITGDFLNNGAPHNDRDPWCHVGGGSS